MSTRERDVITRFFFFLIFKNYANTFKQLVFILFLASTRERGVITTCFILFSI